MKYIITAKYINPHQSHITDPLQRTEICTEMIMTRLKAIELLNTGVISKNDCIVTRIDRKCLYKNIFDNVIDYFGFTSMVPYPKEIAGKEVIDLVADINTYDATIPYHPFYQRYEQDKEQIHSINICAFSGFADRPFIALLIRLTPNHPEKNLSKEYWEKFVNDYCVNNPKHDVFVFGLNNETLDVHQAHLSQVKYLESFHIWCSLLTLDNCKCVISSCTGGVYPIFFCGHPQSRLLIIDNNKYVAQHNDSPSFYNPCINFTKAKVKIIEHVPGASELTEIIKQYAL